jgi:tetratricopeptide (TPR) repeat protein
VLFAKRIKDLGQRLARAAGSRSGTASGHSEFGRIPVKVGWLPPREFERSRSLWPENVDYQAYCQQVELFLRGFASVFESCSLIPVGLDAYRSWCAAEGVDPADRSNFSTYSGTLDSPELVRWPPVPEAACWCRSGRPYAQCCGAVTDDQAGQGDAVLEEFEALRQQVDEAEQEFQHTGELEALEAQVLALRRITSHPALAAAPPDFRHTARGKLALALMDRFQARKRIEDLRESVEVIQAAIDDLPAGSPYRADDLSGLATLLSNLYEHTNDLAVLGRMIEVLTQAVAETPEGSPEHQERALSLASAHRMRYEQSGDPADFERAMELLSAVVDVAKVSARGYEYFVELGSLYVARYSRAMNRHDLDHCIEAFRQALALVAADHPDRPGCANQLAMSLRDRYKRTGDLADLDEAIRTLGELSEELTSSPDPGLFILSNLGIFFRMRYEHLGRYADLQRAITAYERVLAAGDTEDAGGRVRPFALNNLGVALMFRYEWAGVFGDLKLAQAYLEQAVTETPPESPVWWERLQNLSSVLVKRMSHTNAIEDVDRALEALERTQAATPEGPVYPAKQQAMLVAIRATRFRLSGDPEDNESVIFGGQRALASLPPEEPERQRLLNDLGHALLTRFRRTGESADLERAVEIFELATDVPSTDWPYLPRQVANLAAALRTRHDRTGGSDDLERTVSLYRAASQHTDKGDLRGRITGALDWATWAARRRAWDELAEACSCGLELVVRRARVTLLSEDQAWRKERQLLAHTAAALSGVEVMLPTSRVLDRIGATLAADASKRSRTRLERLGRDGHSDLLERYRAVTDRLRGLDRSSLDGPRRAETPVRYRRALAAEWAALDATLEEVRALDASIRDDLILGGGEPLWRQRSTSSHS